MLEQEFEELREKKYEAEEINSYNYETDEWRYE